MQPDSCSTWVEIDLAAIRSNIRQIQTIAARPVMAVVKANAYGHGLVAVARAAQEAGAAWCAVARIEEALALRSAGLDIPLLVLGYSPPERVGEAIAGDIHLTVFNPDVARQYADRARSAGGRLKVQVKLDSGMGRLGIFAEEGVEFVRFLHSLPELLVSGVFTHMALADEPGEPATNWQLDRFTGAIEGLQAAGLRPPLVHAANSAAALYHPRARFDLVRPGIAIYGLHPSPNAALPAEFRPALSWKARLVSLKELPPGHGVSYCFQYTTRARERIGVIPVGYADGLRRPASHVVLVGGKRAPVIGMVCMDQCMLQLDGVPQARPGDEVVILGRQGEEELSAEAIGDAWGTINYEVVCGLAARLPRIYR